MLGATRLFLCFIPAIRSCIRFSPFRLFHWRRISVGWLVRVRPATANPLCSTIPACCAVGGVTTIYLFPLHSSPFPLLSSSKHTNICFLRTQYNFSQSQSLSTFASDHSTIKTFAVRCTYTLATSNTPILLNIPNFTMPSIKNILLSLAFAAVVASQSQISDGQIQAATSTVAPVAQITDGQIQAATKASTVAPVSQITDGQIQAPTKATTTVAPVSQITDGQIQAPSKATTTVAPVSQITDGQIQAPSKATTTVAPVSQITDGQIQAPSKATTTVAPVSQITDGQIQAPSKPASISVVPSPSANGTFATGAPVATFKGAANLMSWNKEIFGVAVGVAAGFAML
jgi:hypothetical protein